MSASRAVGHHRDAAPNEQRTNPGGGSDLVTADAHEVQSEARKGDVHGRQGLGRIAVDEAAGPVREHNTVGDRLNGADLGGHEGHGGDREATVPRRRRVVARNHG